MDRIVQKLVKDYAFSSQANYRKGGLLCLAAAAVALAEQNKVRNPTSWPCTSKLCQDYHHPARHTTAEHGVPGCLQSIHRALAGCPGCCNHSAGKLTDKAYHTSCRWR